VALASGKYHDLVWMQPARKILAAFQFLAEAYFRVTQRVDDYDDDECRSV
jgi:hypothetical protein